MAEMTTPTARRAPYRVAWCPAEEAATAAELPAEIADLFATEELAALRAIAGDKRRRDRIAGRLAAKRALREHFRAEHGWDANPRELVLGNDDAGRPSLLLPRGAPAAPSFSISHSSAGGVCAVGAEGRRVGCDLEEVVLRPRAVLTFAASADELTPALLADPLAQARLWTGKEAVLKLLGLGLDADPRMVETTADGAARLAGVPAETWSALGAPKLKIDFLDRGGSLAAVAHTGG